MKSASTRIALAIVTSLFLLELPAHAALDPSTGVLAEELVDVTIQELADLTTLPQRASNTVHADAVAVAPPRADWIQTSRFPACWCTARCEMIRNRAC